MRPSNLASAKRILLLPLVLVGLTACQPVWVDDGSGTTPFAAVAGACKADASHGIYGQGVVGLMNDRAAVQRCIASHGYRLTDPRDVTPPAVSYPDPA